MRTLGVLSVLCLAILTGLPAMAEETDSPSLMVRRLMGAVDRNLCPADEITEASLLLIHPNGQQRRWRIKHYYQRAPENSMGAVLLRFLEPADLRGTTLVSVNQPGGENFQWLYLPAFRTPQFLTGSRKTDYVFGSDFTFEDFAPNVLDDYGYEWVRDDEIDRRRAVVVRRTPIAPKLVERVSYSYQNIWIDPDRLVILRADSFDSLGRLYKTCVWSDFYMPDAAHWRARHVALFSPLRPHWTELTIETIDLNRGLPRDFFSERNLTNIR